MRSCQIPCRARDNSAYEIAEELQLSSGDIAQGVWSDQIAELGKDRTEANGPNHKVRIVIVELNSKIYRVRWLIEKILKFDLFKI